MRELPQETWSVSRRFDTSAVISERSLSMFPRQFPIIVVTDVAGSYGWSLVVFSCSLVLVYAGIEFESLFNESSPHDKFKHSMTSVTFGWI